MSLLLPVSRLDRLRSRGPIVVSGLSDVECRLSAIVGRYAIEIGGESSIEREDRLQILGLFGGEFDLESLRDGARCQRQQRPRFG